MHSSLVWAGWVRLSLYRCATGQDEGVPLRDRTRLKLSRYALRNQEVSILSRCSTGLGYVLTTYAATSSGLCSELSNTVM